MTLDFHGITVELNSEYPGLLDSLRRDFEYFLSPQPGQPRIHWTLRPTPAPQDELPRGRAGWSCSDYAVYGSGRIRRILFDDGALAVYDYRFNQGIIYSARPERLHELAYLAVLSRVGEELDRRGLHRVHALGFEKNGLGGLILMDSGLGKSTLALKMLLSTDMGIAGEETPLICGHGKIIAFPLRWAFRPEADLSMVDEKYVRSFRRRRYGLKRVVDVGFFRSRIKSGLPLRWLLIGGKGQGQPRIEPISRWQAFIALARGLILGIGVAQMAEYMLRFDAGAILSLLDITRRRTCAALRLLLQTRPQRFTLSPDPARNIEILEKFIARQETHPMTEHSEGMVDSEVVG